MKIVLKCFIFITIISNTYSQNLIKKQGCVHLYGEAYVTNSGAEYNAWIENTCSKYVHVSPSEYEVVFRKLSSSGKEINGKRSIRIKEAFISPNATLYKDKSGSDGATTYLSVKTEDGNLGECSYFDLSVPSGYVESQGVKNNEKTLIGQQGDLYVYAELKSNFWASWPGFEQYKLMITVTNKGVSVVKDVVVDYSINFYGYIYFGKEKFNKVNGLQSEEKTKVIDPIFNFDPIGYLKIGGESTIKAPDYTQTILEPNTNTEETNSNQQQHSTKTTKTVIDLEKVNGEITSINSKIDEAVENMDFETASELKKN